MAQTTDKAEVSDETLIARIAAAKDKGAFTLLYQRYAGRIKGMVLKSGATHAEADETAQEAMLAVWRRAEQYDPAKAGAPTWIFTIARNRRIDLIRRASRPEPDQNDPLFTPDPPEQPDRALSSSERDAAVREAVAELTEAQREVVRLAYFAGLSQQEIAKRLDVPLGTVKSRMRLAGDRMRGVLGEGFAEELQDV